MAAENRAVVGQENFHFNRNARAYIEHIATIYLADLDHLRAQDW
jgi:hypothetical protein